jgi:hypothetical protein
MDLSTIRIRLRRDLQDEGSPSRFSDDELDRAISRAVVELSKYSPYQTKIAVATVPDSDEINVSSLSDVISIDRVEYPIGNAPRTYARFEVYADSIRLLETMGDGEECYIYWSTLHTLDADSSTLSVAQEELVALGASAYAVLSLSQAKVDTNNPGGTGVNISYREWALDRAREFEKGLKQLKSKIHSNQLYVAD